MVGFLIAFLLIADIPEERFTTLQEEMVFTQIIERAIRDQPTLNAMRMVKRHRFVPERLKAYAYEDGPLPIGHGQTISQPYIVAYMTEFLRLKPGSSVLEIGTGSGYQAAVLSCIAGEVYTVEIIAELGQQAQKRLKALGYQNVMVRVADGYNGWEEHAPYDAIIVTAAAEYIPPPLIKQLKDGGRMVIPVGSPFLVQTLMLVEKSGGVVKTKSLLPVRFVPLIRGK